MPAFPFQPALGLACFLPCFPSAVLAQDLSTPGALGADILPRGRSAVRVETRGSWADQQYDARGRREPLGADYAGMALDATLFPGLLPPGMTLGTTDLSARMVGRQVRLTYGYGFNEDLTAGFQIGYGEAVNHVRASVAGSNLAANPLFNPALPMAFPNVPFVPLGTFGLTTPTGTEAV